MNKKKQIERIIQGRFRNVVPFTDNFTRAVEDIQELYYKDPKELNEQVASIVIKHFDPEKEIINVWGITQDLAELCK